jgi:hypothetical protein
MELIAVLAWEKALLSRRLIPLDSVDITDNVRTGSGKSHLLVHFEKGAVVNSEGSQPDRS